MRRNYDIRKKLVIFKINIKMNIIADNTGNNRGPFTKKNLFLMTAAFRREVMKTSDIKPATERINYCA